MWLVCLLPHLRGANWDKAYVEGCGPIADLLSAEADKLFLLAAKPETDKGTGGVGSGTLSPAAAPAGAKLEPAGQTTTASVSPSPPRGDENLCLSPADLANRYKVPRGALESRLKRWRKCHGDGWKQVTDPKPREPRYLYCVSAVWSVIQNLARATGETTGEGPAK